MHSARAALECLSRATSLRTAKRATTTSSNGMPCYAGTRDLYEIRVDASCSTRPAGNLQDWRIVARHARNTDAQASN
jgi:hypothetical protein